MKRLASSSLPVLLVIFMNVSVRADGILLSWNARDVPGITQALFDSAKTWSVDEILKRNAKVTSWPECYLLMVAASQHKTDPVLLDGLVGQLTDRSMVRLRDTSRLIIWKRITSGEIVFEGKGYHVSDDLFSTAGRANWLLRNLSGKTFGYVKPTSAEKELSELKARWKGFREGVAIEQFVDPFQTAEKGLAEIRSLEALEGLISSLKPRAEKEDLTRACLKKLYNLDEFPNDPSSPARLCSPDAFTPRYLAIITDVSDPHEYSWWQKWWDTNRSNLQWNSTKGRFEVPK